MERDEFYDILQNGSDFPKTSQPSPQTFLDIFEEAKDKGDEIICILLSSKLSGTFQTANIAKEMADYDGIYIIDSRSATFTIKVMADYALKLIQQGFSAQDIAEKIENLKTHVRCIAGLSTLEYLAKGGRLSKTVAAVGNVANIKPVIELDEEQGVSVAAKCLGKTRAIQQVIRMVESRDIDNSFPIYPIVTCGTENCEMMEEKLEESGYKLDQRLQVGPTIGTHIGPDAFGLIFVTKGGTD